MPESYPLPSYAASIWVAGDDIMIAFPGEAAGRGHTIKLPASARGFDAAVQLLRERATATRHRLSDPGTPSQYEIERALAHDRKYAAILSAMGEAREAKAEARAEAEAKLTELGL